MKKLDVNIDINGTPFKNNKNYSNDKWFAQKIGDSHWVMASTEGFLFNPLDLSDNINKIDKERGRPFYSLQKCNYTCYKYYVNFLRSKQRTNLVLAERSFRERY
jgi:hypothetical protein